MVKRKYRNGPGQFKKFHKSMLGTRNVFQGGRGYFRKSGYYGRYGGGFNDRRVAKREAKFFDTAVANNTVGTSGEIFSLSLNLVPGGTTESQRVGRLMIVKQLNARFLVKNGDQTDVGNDAWMRFIIYCDKQTNGATAAVLDLIETADVLAYSNLANSTRFRILWSKWVKLPITAAAGNGTTNHHNNGLALVSCSIPLNLQIDFEGVTGAITELCCNNIGVLAISSLASTEVEMNARLRYFD